MTQRPLAADSRSRRSPEAADPDHSSAALGVRGQALDKAPQGELGALFDAPQLDIVFNRPTAPSMSQSRSTMAAATQAASAAWFARRSDQRPRQDSNLRPAA